ncbi:MAG: hypothetical protein V1720_01910 [bacterium]
MIRFSNTALIVLPNVVIVLLCLFMLARMISDFSITNDSTFYLTAAKNLVEKGELLVYSNWPSHSMQPEMEKYTEYPPGFPLYLSLFILIFRNQFLAAMIAQSVAIVLLFLSLHLVALRLDLKPFTKIVFFVFLTFLIPFKLITVNLWSETIFVSLALLGLNFSLKIINGDDTKRNWIYGALFLFLASWVRYIGILDVALFVVPILLSNRLRKKLLRTLLIVLFVSAPVFLWFLRSKILYGITTESHGVGYSIDTARLMDPLIYLYKIFGWNKAIAWCFVLLFAVILVFPLFTKSNQTQIVKHKHLLVVAVIYFIGTYLISLLASFDSLNHRILAPVIILGVIVLFSGVDLLYNILSNGKYGIIVFIIPLLIMMNMDLFNYNLELELSTKYPAEKLLWEKVEKIDQIKNSSHFYTDYNYKHQLFCKIPHRVIYFESLTDEIINKLQSIGKNPFYIFKLGSSFDEFLSNNYCNYGLRRVELVDVNYSLYLSIK